MTETWPLREDYPDFWSWVRAAVKSGYRPKIMLENFKGDVAFTLHRGNHRLGTIMVLSEKDLITQFPSLGPTLKETHKDHLAICERWMGEIESAIAEGKK